MSMTALPNPQKVSPAAAGRSTTKLLISSLSAKSAMAVTGLGLVLFVIAHMLGNLQIYLGQEALNAYAYKLKSMPALLWTARVGLVAIFVVHLGMAFYLRRVNKVARPQAYAYPDPVEASFASRTMLLSGLAIFAFVIYHLLHFTLGVTDSRLHQLVDAKGHHDVYSMVVISFQNLWVSIAYIVAMLFLGLHLSHAISSMMQTAGWVSATWRPWVTRMGTAIAAVLMMGNISIPVAILLGLVGLPEGVAP